MAQGSTVEFGEVFVVRETETALLCRIGEKVRWVAHSHRQPGSTVEHPGDLGMLVLPWDFAVEFWDGAMRDKRRRPLCDGVRLDGLPRRGARLPESRFCFSHDPTTAREREAAQAAGSYQIHIHHEGSKRVFRVGPVLGPFHLERRRGEGGR